MPRPFQGNNRSPYPGPNLSPQTRWHAIPSPWQRNAYQPGWPWPKPTMPMQPFWPASPNCWNQRADAAARSVILRSAATETFLSWYGAIGSSHPRGDSSRSQGKAKRKTTASGAVRMSLGNEFFNHGTLGKARKQSRLRESFVRSPRWGSCRGRPAVQVSSRLPSGSSISGPRARARSPSRPLVAHLSINFENGPAGGVRLLGTE